MAGSCCCSLRLVCADLTVSHLHADTLHFLTAAGTGWQKQQLALAGVGWGGGPCLQPAETTKASPSVHAHRGHPGQAGMPLLLGGPKAAGHDSKSGSLCSEAMGPRQSGDKAWLGEG